MAQHMPPKDIEFIASFAAFCRTKGDEDYNPCDANVCALAQFGHPGVPYSECERFGIPRDAMNAALSEPWVFSALADRLEALLVDAPVVERQ